MDKNTIDLLRSRKSDHWKTPEDLYNKLNKKYNFDYDPCPFMADFDGLTIDWGKRCFVNPPYSKLKEFLIKSKEEIEKGNTELTVFLVFSNTDTKWFHEYILDKAEIIFIKGRLSFVGLDGVQGNAMRPSMLCVFKK